MYAARQLSFAGVKFSINEVPLSADFVDMYNASVKLVSDFLHILTRTGKLSPYTPLPAPFSFSAVGRSTKVVSGGI